MSRKSKRRRTRHVEMAPATQRPDPADGFEFLDDRRSGVPQPVPTRVVPEPVVGRRVESVPALGGARVVTGGDTAEAASPGRGVKAHSGRTPTSSAETTPVAPGEASAANGPAGMPPPAAAEPPVTTLGELLTTTREARGLSIEEASARTRISAKMLSHLENDRFGEFAAEAYVRGSLRAYGSFLGLDHQLLLARYEALQSGRPQPAPEIWEAAVEVARPAPRRRRPSRRTWVVSAVVGGVVIVGGTTFFLARQGVVTLRPAAGLQQIEDELRRAQEAPATPTAPAAPELEVPTSVPAAPESPGGRVAVGASSPSPVEDTSHPRRRLRNAPP